MKQLLFGYGSLINLESASRTVQRKLTREDINAGILEGYERNWTLWDDVTASTLEKQVRGVFLNLAPLQNAFCNGVMFEISDEELAYFVSREKNYNCVDVTNLITRTERIIAAGYRVVTFVGKAEHIVTAATDGYFVFDRYLDIVNTGVHAMGNEFINVFNNTTRPNIFPTLPGIYTFVNTAQQKAR